jgi:DnaJ-domain-containing protein 1
MTFTEIAVVVFGLFAGYWVVSKLFFRTRPPDAVPRPMPPTNSEPPSAAWHEILQVPADAPAEAIRDAYKRMISKYHPDKVESLGEELKVLAAAKSSDITSAYREGMTARGVNP